MRAFSEEGVDWPAQSPDLNLMEQLQDELEWRFRSKQAKQAQTLWKAFPEDLKLLKLQRQDPTPVCFNCGRKLELLWKSQARTGRTMQTPFITFPLAK